MWKRSQCSLPKSFTPETPKHGNEIKQLTTQFKTKIFPVT